MARKKSEGAAIAACATDEVSRASRTIAEAEIVMARTMQPPDANVWGNIHGGAIMRLVDEAGPSRCATRADHVSPWRWTR
jgi:acyl-CoA hydrolase